MMHPTRTAALAAVMLCAPLAAATQGLVSERFGYCFMVDVPSRTLWTTPVYELDIQYGTLSAQMAQDKAQFRSRIAQGTRLAQDTDAVCVYKASRAEAESEIDRTRKAFRFSRVDWTQVAWVPTPAANLAMPPRPAAEPSPAAPMQAAATTSAARPADTGDIEADYWNRIVDSQVAEDFDDYLQAFPKGRHAPLARLEAKRLRRDGATPNRPTASSRSVAATTPPVAAAQATPASGAAIDAAVAQRLASDAFFRLPAGKGAQATWAGRRIVTTRIGGRTIESPVVQSSTLRREADTCSIDVHVESGGGGDVFTTDSRGATWAGLVPLAISSRTSSKYAISEGHSTATSLRHGEAGLFPLRPGATVEFGVGTRNQFGAAAPTMFEQSWTCRVGPTVAASGVLPGTPGDATGLACTMSMPGSDMTFEQAYYWFGDVGCFVQDPNRP